MRRPAKPFVKEYRAPTRRTRDNGAPARGAETSWTDDVRHGGDDGGYLAAMRAADALFATPRQARTPDGDSDAAERQEMPAQGGARADEPRGRILQAIEEPEEDAFAALEAERTPKRRGRKPGSKNKPKIAIPVAEPVSAPAAAMAVSSASAPASAPVGGSFLPMASHAAPQTASAKGAPAADAAPLVPRTRRGTERFAWVRTKLGPGERWKRRLPKVAW